MKSWLLILVAFCIVIKPNNAFAAEWGLVGFGENNIKAFFVDPNNNQKMIVNYANPNSFSATYTSENGGEEWTEVEMKPRAGFCSQFEKDTANKSVYWAACNDGIYYSVDNANSFSKLQNSAPQGPVEKILISSDNEIYALKQNSIYYSKDGIFWTNIKKPSGSGWVNIFLDKKNSILYLSKAGDISKSPGLYKSTDNGNSWLKINGSSPFYNGLNTLIFFDDTMKLCATNNAGFACSTNGGLTWSGFKSLKSGVEHESGRFYRAIQNPEDENNIFVLVGGLDFANNVIYHSIDGGVIWNSIKSLDYSSSISISMGEVFVWAPNSDWLKGIWKIGGITTMPEYSKKHPVIVVPGLLGSWKVLGEWKIDPILHTYDGLIEALNKNGYEKEKMLFTFPYNWRNDNSETAKLLKIKIDEVKRISGASKVDIVAHSMGGLVSRAYAESNYYENDIDQLIFLGTPQTGASKVYAIWEAGDVSFDGGVSGSILEAVLKEEADIRGYKGKNKLFDYIREDIKSVPQLLPIFNYLKFNNGINFFNYPDLYPRNIFLENLEKNKQVLESRNIRTLNIVGDTGGNTVNGFVLDIRQSDKGLLWADGQPIDYYEKDNSRGVTYAEGDGTVPLISNQSFLERNIILKNVSHSDLPNKASNKILDELGVEVNKSCSIDPVKEALIFIAYSPVDFYIIDPNGKKIGTNTESIKYFDQIEGAFYSGNEPSDAEFVVIPNPPSGQYKIVTIGTGGGSFEIKSIYSNENNNTYYSHSFVGEAVMDEILGSDITFNSTKEEILDVSDEDNEIKKYDININEFSIIRVERTAEITDLKYVVENKELLSSSDRNVLGVSTSDNVIRDNVVIRKDNEAVSREKSFKAKIKLFFKKFIEVIVKILKYISPIIF